MLFSTDQIDGSAYGNAGYFCQESQYQYVLPKSDRFVDKQRKLYVLGYAGADGIEFVLKPNEDCVYAYYPSVDELHKLAPDFSTFIDGWINGRIAV